MDERCWGGTLRELNGEPEEGKGLNWRGTKAGDW